MTSINQAVSNLQAIADVQYVEGVHDGLRIAANLAERAEAEGGSPARKLQNALAYFEEHKA